jgi:hypothetical protein
LQDCFWSAQDDDQLIGRVHRYPQCKEVFVYRLIAARTADVMLNNLCFAMADLIRLFTTAGPLGESKHRHLALYVIR